MYVTPKKASDHFKVSEQCLRTWGKQGKIKYTTTEGGHRRYLISEGNIPEPQVIKAVYARVSSRKQKEDLEHQVDFLKENYPGYEVFKDIGSGINFERTNFKRILEGVFQGTIGEVVVTQRDRWTRFGYDLFEWIFVEHNAKLICHETFENEKTENEELTEDIMAIITVFSSRYYGRRRYNLKGT